MTYCDWCGARLPLVGPSVRPDACPVCTHPLGRPVFQPEMMQQARVQEMILATLRRVAAGLDQLNGVAS